MIRLLTGIICLFCLSGTVVSAQPDAATTERTALMPAKPLAIPSRPELLRRIALYETAARNAALTHANPGSTAAIYVNLGTLYKDARPVSEVRRRLAARHRLAQGWAATATRRRNHATGFAACRNGQAPARRKNQLQALAIRTAIGEPIGIALAWNDLAGVYLKRGKFRQALEDAQRAFHILGNREDVSPANRIAVRQTLGFALCGLKNCAQGIPILRDALDLSKVSYGQNSLLAAVNEYVLGYSAWQCGDRSKAAEWLEHGTMRMNIALGSDHPMYVNAMRQYARFLRETGQVELAASA